MAENILGTELIPCSHDPKTGFYRDGCCNTGPEDRGAHTVCVRVTQEFLAYSQTQGNDLSTPMPQYGFPGLKPGDCWCLCALRWKQAFEDGMAPNVILAATHKRTLDMIPMSDLLRHAEEPDVAAPDFSKF